MTDIAFDLDELLEGAVLHGALADGRAPGLAAVQFGAAQAIAAARETAVRRDPSRKINRMADRWTAAEADFLRRAAGVLGDVEIAARLGRTVHGVRVQRRRMDLPGPMVHPDYLTGNDMAYALGIDGHSIIKLIERGLLAAEVAPVVGRRFWRMRRAAFVAWALRPGNWPYFYRSVRRPERIRDAKLRRLIAHRAARWLGPDGRPDEWWTSGEVARYHGVTDRDVTRYIYRGLLPSAVQWGNWMVRRSDATRPGLKFYKGKGEGRLEPNGTPAGDAFLVLATAVGIPATQIARMVGGISHATIPSRVLAMHRRGLIPWLIRAFALPVLYRADAPGNTRSTDGLLWADWRAVAHRFPRLAAAWPRAVADGLRGMAAMRDRNLVNGVLRAAVAWNLGPGHPLMRGLLYRMRAAEVEALALWDGWAEVAREAS